MDKEERQEARAERKEERSEKKDEKFENREWNEAIAAAQSAFDQLGDVDMKLDEEEPKRAALHLRKAVDRFKSALTHLEKADVGREQKGAVDDMNLGIKELGDAVTDLEEGKTDSAQRHYDKAAESLSKAESILT
jgi:hypothetical protein